MAEEAEAAWRPTPVERRGAFRVQPSCREPVFAAVATDRATIAGTVRDLSVEGVSILVATQGDTLRPSPAVVEIGLKLPRSSDWSRFAGELVRMERRGSVTIYGFRLAEGRSPAFVALQRQLTRYVLERQLASARFRTQHEST